MTFTSSPNEMIQFGSSLNPKDLSEFQNEMIQKFYPDADIDTINKMMTWAKYPTLNCITLNELKTIESNIRENKFKAIPAQMIDQDQLNKHNQVIGKINSARESGLQSNNNPRCWNHLMNASFEGFDNTKMHLRFVNIISSIWDKLA